MKGVIAAVFVAAAAADVQIPAAAETPSLWAAVTSAWDQGVQSFANFQHLMLEDIHKTKMTKEELKERNSLALMKKGIADARKCHLTCGRDSACQKQCPEPWHEVRQMCHNLRPLKACITKCTKQHLGQQCSTQCRANAPADVQHKAVEIAHKWLSMEMRCHGVEEVARCHSACRRGSIRCHKRCPLLLSPWAKKLHAPSKHPKMRKSHLRGHPTKRSDKDAVVEQDLPVDETSATLNV